LRADDFVFCFVAFFFARAIPHSDGSKWDGNARPLLRG
jgi:hypothetical protein